MMCSDCGLQVDERERFDYFPVFVADYVPPVFGMVFADDVPPVFEMVRFDYVSHVDDDG